MFKYKHFFICFYILVFLTFSAVISLAAPHPDLLAQLDAFETKIKNASGDMNQIKTLIQEKIDAFPDDTPFISAFAAFLVPDKASNISEIATTLMPDFATQIAFAVSYSVPDAAKMIQNICSEISPDQNSDITIACNVAVSKRNSSAINFGSAYQLALTAADETDLFMKDITPPPPVSVYGQ